MAAQGQAPGEVVSIRIPESLIAYCSRTASPTAEYDYADCPKPVSTYLRRAAPWTHRIWIAIHFRPPPPLALRTMPRYCLKGHRAEGRQSRRRLKATFRTPGAKGARLPGTPSSALSRTPRRNLQWFRTRAGGPLPKGQDARAGDLCPSRGTGQSTGSASQRFHRRRAPHYYECGDQEGSVRQERTD